MIIRDENNSDIAATDEVTTAAFKNLAISNHAEQFIIPALVHEGVSQEVFFALPFTEMVPKGTVVFHEGFSAKG
jgi:predicted N-acetyltransferase YhbS